MTQDRLIHLLISLLFVFVLYRWKKQNITVPELTVLGATSALGSWLPDWDLLLGIGFHRSPFTHSVLPCILAFMTIRKYSWWPIPLAGLALGISSHLIWDIIFYGDVRLIQGGNNDRIFLLLNAIALIAISLLIIRKLETYRLKEGI